MGVMWGAYRRLNLTLSNPGPHSASILDKFTSQPLMATWLKVPHLEEILEPSSEIEVAILVRAAGLPAGSQSAQLTLTYRCEGVNDVTKINIAFTVPQCPQFMLDTYPRVFSLQTQKESKLFLECCNYSDRPGTVMISHKNFGTNVPEVKLFLRPRQTVLHECLINPELLSGASGWPTIVLTDLDTAAYVAVPIFSMVAQHESAK